MFTPGGIVMKYPMTMTITTIGGILDNTGHLSTIRLWWRAAFDPVECNILVKVFTFQFESELNLLP